MKNTTVKLPEWIELKEKAMAWEYGSIHGHSELAAIMRLDLGSPKYYSMIQRANKELLKNGKALKSFRGQGYQVAKPDDYNDLAIGKFKASKRHFENGVKVLLHAPVALMSGDAQQRHKYLYDRSTYRLALESGGLRELEELNKPKVK